MAATLEGLKTYLGLDPATSIDDAAMASAVAAANAKAIEWRPDVTLDAEGVELPAWPSYMDQGAYTLRGAALRPKRIGSGSRGVRGDGR